MLKRLIGLALPGLVVLGFMACAHVDPDTYKPIGHEYNRDDGWFVDASGNWQQIVNGSATGTYFSGAGALTVAGAHTFTGDLTIGGGAGALTSSSSGDSTLVVTDADSTAFCMGAAGALDLACLDTTDASPALDVKGIAGQIGLHLDAGTAQLDESPTIGAGAAGIDYTLSFNGETSDGTLQYMEDEDRFDFDNLQSDGTLGVTGDATLSGGAGALTFDDTASSAVLPDNDASAFDFGASGQTDMVRFNTSNGSENVEFRSPAIFTGIYDSFAEGASKGLTTLLHDGLAVSGAAGVTHYAYFGNGTILGYAAIGNNAADDINTTATGLNIANDQNADNEGREIWSGYGGASGRPLVVGTDPAFYFLVGINIGDIDGTDTVLCGFKKLETHNATQANYDTYFGLGATTSADPMALKVIEELNGAAGDSTDTTDTLQDGITLQIKVLVSADGTATVQHDADVPGTLEAPDATSAFQFDDGDLLVPICTYLEHTAGGYTDTFDITHWEVGLQ